jgi:ABC-type multidrug transport system fused ATPase/permease subunit
VAIVVAAMLVQAAMGLAGPWPLKVLIDNVIGDHPLPQWAKWLASESGSANKMHVAVVVALLVVVIAVVTALAGYIANYFIEKIGQSVANDLRLRIYHHLYRLSLNWHRSHQVGAILSTLTTDVATIQIFTAQGTVHLLVSFLTIVGMLIVMVLVRWDFALIAIGLVPILVLLMSRIRTAVQETTRIVRDIDADMMAVAQEGLEAVEVVQAFERQDLEEKLLAGISRRSVEASLRARRVRSLLAPVATIPIAMCTAFVLWRGTALITAGAMTLGSLTVVIAYLARFFGPVQDFSEHTDIIARTAVAVQRVQGLLEADAVISERAGAVDPPSGGEIAYENVAFGYEHDVPVLRDVSFTVGKGQLIGIVGATGSGKSTVVSLLLRFYDVNSGAIRIGGRDIRELKLHELRNQVAFVMQDTVLFRGTVRDNIAFGRPDATEDDIVQAAKLANADEFIVRMSHGYESFVGERGLTLSAGQRQRIGIARALIRNCPILILDEPSAALDAEAEKAVLEGLRPLITDRTVICIAHRLSTIRDAHKIVVLRDGTAAEQGTHEDLMERNGVYADLYRMQNRAESA